jgi:hypothetical protein
MVRWRHAFLRCERLSRFWNSRESLAGWRRTLIKAWLTTDEVAIVAARDLSRDRQLFISNIHGGVI